MLDYTKRAGQLSKSRPARNTVNFLSNMTTVAPLSPREPDDSFVIGNYLRHLTPSKKEKNKYICPACEGHNLSVDKDGIGYQCYNCEDTNKIAFLLRQKNNDFKPKRGRKPKQLTQGNNPDTEATPIVAESSSRIKNIRSYPEVLDFIRKVWGQSLSWNLRSLEVELHGCKLDADTIHMRLADEYRVNISKDSAKAACFYLASKKGTDSTLNWLTSLRGIKSSVIPDSVAGLLFKLDDPFYNEMIWKWMLAAVKRVFEPGCKFDPALVLYGRQHIGKSTFFRTLANGSFSDSMTEKLNTDDMRIMNRHWINEWGELDNFIGKVYDGKIKHFLSRQEEWFRIPYATDMVNYPRRSMIVGTTNQNQLLTDTTGNRRFWILPVEWIIPPDLLETLRDELWAAAVADYWENWRGPHNEITLSEDSRRRQSEENELYLWHDVIEEALIDYLHGKTIHVTMTEVLAHLQGWTGADLGIKAGDKGTAKRVGGLLSKLGWKRSQQWIGGKNQKIWLPPAEK